MAEKPRQKVAAEATLNHASDFELQRRKGLRACGCLMELRHRVDDVSVYFTLEGYPSELYSGSTVRINCIWSRGVMDFPRKQNGPIFTTLTHSAVGQLGPHCPSVPLLCNWDHIDTFSRRTALHRSKNRKVALQHTLAINLLARLSGVEHICLLFHMSRQRPGQSLL
jgi:hypothetical protein